ncbi:ATP-binding protein [bacterium]|nr:ATP-binding protein [bacterium]
MKRDVYKKLIEWKNDLNRKPLILKGARQVGKTYILNEFGEKEFENFVYLNFEQNSEFCSFFENGLFPENIIEKISFYFNTKVDRKNTLIIFDEIQECPKALTSLKYFSELKNKYYVVAAGSLLGLKFGVQSAFPVGKVDIIDLYPLSFTEFLAGIGKENLKKVLENIDKISPIDKIFHKMLLEDFKLYSYIGGLPEIINTYNKSKDFKKIREKQITLLDTYELDFSKHTTKSEANKIDVIWHQLESQIAKENKRFIFTDVSKHARANKYFSSLQWLKNCGLIYSSYKIRKAEIPLKAYKVENQFKLFFFDIGLLSAKLNLSGKLFLNEEILLNQFKGIFAENIVSQELVTSGFKELYYWSSGNTAELDLLIEYGSEIYPVEIKSGKSKAKKSLKVYDERLHPKKMIRISTNNLKEDGRIINIPIYAVSIIKVILPD